MLSILLLSRWKITFQNLRASYLPQFLTTEICASCNVLRISNSLFHFVLCHLARQSSAVVYIEIMQSLPLLVTQVSPSTGLGWMVLCISWLWKIVIMATKWKRLDLNMKLEIIHFCEVSSLSETKLGRWCEWNSSTLFTILKARKYGVYCDVYC
jgi:hypothetical protein